MSEVLNATATLEMIGNLAANRDNLNIPANIRSKYINVNPPATFPGTLNPATIEINLDSTVSPETASGISIYRASQESDWIFVELETEAMSAGRVAASTSQGGVFVAGSGVDYGLVTGLVITGVVLLVIAVLMAGLIIYFVVRPEKWASAKSGLSKTKMNLKRSFANQI